MTKNTPASQRPPVVRRRSDGQTLTRTSEPPPAEPVSSTRLRIAPRAGSSAPPPLRSSAPPPRAPAPTQPAPRGEAAGIVDCAIDGWPSLGSSTATLDGVPRRLELPPPPLLPRALVARSSSPPVAAQPLSNGVPSTLLVLDCPFDGARRHRRLLAAFVTLLVAIAASLATSVALSYA
jgi:hypothetical protein